jgi:hypothetical protein
MRLSTLVITGLSAAFVADSLFSGGAHGAIAVAVLRRIVHGVLLGLAHFT